MTCPKCKANNSRILATRRIGHSRKRRHLCLNCRKRFNTFESSVNLSQELKLLRALQAKIDETLRRLSNVQ
jgi:transcriptional regulator NrdR family protein